MNHPDIPPIIRPLFQLEKLSPVLSGKPQEIEDSKGETKRIVKRLAAIVEDHRLSAASLGIVFTGNDLRSVIHALRDHARGGPGIPMPGTRDEIHAHVLTRLFEELVEEPSNILHFVRSCWRFWTYYYRLFHDRLNSNVFTSIGFNL